jgi:CRP-like cAMP-binding protein
MSAMLEQNETRFSASAPSVAVATDLPDLLSRSGARCSVVSLKPQQTLFVQGDEPDAVFYVKQGRAKVAAVSKRGKEATISLISAGDFIGEEALAGLPGLPGTLGPRVATATTLSECVALRIERTEMMRVIREERAVAELFLGYLLARIARAHADLIDHLLHSSEQRLARALLLMADLAQAGESGVELPLITQGTLAEMVGTTRSRVSFFMNRFRARGFIEYDRQIRVNRSLRNVVLHDRP